MPSVAGGRKGRVYGNAASMAMVTMPTTASTINTRINRNLVWCVVAVPATTMNITNDSAPSSNNEPHLVGAPCSLFSSLFYVLTVRPYDQQFPANPARPAHPRRRARDRARAERALEAGRRWRGRRERREAPRRHAHLRPEPARRHERRAGGRACQRDRREADG